ncbi:MAG: ion transporter [Bacteroidota bacterium]
MKFDTKMISEDNKYKQIWDLWIGILITFTAIEFPLRLVLDYEVKGFLAFLDVITTICFTVDIFLHFRTTLIISGKLITDKKVISRKYLKSWFIIDFLSAIPFDWIFYLILSGTSGMGIVRLLRLLRLIRLLKIIKVFYYKNKWQHNLHFNESILRLVLFLYLITLISHWFSCGWVHLRTPEGIIPTIQDYVRALYWCTATLTTIGYGDQTPDKSIMVQVIYTIFVMIVGVAMYGYVIGNIASFLANLDLSRANFMEKLSRVNTFMKSKNFPDSIQKRVNRYYNYLWESRHGYDDASVMSELPEFFKYEFALLINKGILEKVPIFNKASPNMIKEIVMSLKPCVYIPGEIICKYGDIGDKMYFISKGKVEVLAENEVDVYATLTEGDFFGEIALLLEQPRNATIRAVDYCDLYSLDKESFDKWVSHYPEFKKEIKAMVQERLDKSAESSDK